MALERSEKHRDILFGERLPLSDLYCAIEEFTNSTICVDKSSPHIVSARIAFLGTYLACLCRNDARNKMIENQNVQWPLTFSDTQLAGRRSRYARDFYATRLTDPSNLLASYKEQHVYYVPIDVSPSHNTRIIFVGLTPGLAQMELAAQAFMEATIDERTDDCTFANLLRSRAAFANSMRKNLCKMLDALIGDDERLRRALDAKASIDLFDKERTDVATTSALVFPVFSGPSLKNFSGGGIDLSCNPLFRTMLDHLLKPRLMAAPRALIIPFGTVASTGIAYLCGAKHIDRSHVLWGMPHPSGANGHRVRLFNENAECMHEQLHDFFNRQKH